MQTANIEKFTRKATERKPFGEHLADKVRKGKMNKSQRGGKSSRFEFVLEA